jgi:hypothetical protein
MTVAHRRSSSLGLEHRIFEAQIRNQAIGFPVLFLQLVQPSESIDPHVLVFLQSSSFKGSPPSGLKELEGRHIPETLTLTEWHIEGPDGAATGLSLPSPVSHSFSSPLSTTNCL